MQASEAQQIDIDTWKAWQAAGQPAQLVDVRSASEFATAHLPGAINIPLEQVQMRTADLTIGSPVVLVCQTGTRARIAADLIQGGDRNIIVLNGGTDAWIRAGNPTVRSTASRWALERQVRLIAGLLVVIGVALGVAVNPWWLVVPGFVGCGLTFAGLSNLCLMGEGLARLPWNRARHSNIQCNVGRKGNACACEIPKRS